MRVDVDYLKCKGHGQCASVAPRVFQLGADDRSHVLLGPGASVAPEDEGRVTDAIVMCPEAAISWAEDNPA